MAAASELRKRINSRLLKEISEVQYPSTTMLNRVEPTLADPDDLSEYIEVLVEKVEATRFPSISLLDRLDGLLAQLEQQQQKQRRQTEGDRERDLQAA